MTDNEAKIAQLKHQRGTIKRKLTSFEKAISDFESNPNVDFEHLDLEGRLAKHDPLWNEFDKVQNELDSLAEDEDALNAHEIERHSFETRFFTLNGKAKTLIKKQELAIINPRASQSSIESNLENANVIDRVENADTVDLVNRENTDNLSSINLQNTGSSGQAGHFILDPNLPKLALPSFSGTFDTWLGFRDTFNSMVHTNAQVPPVFKFHYLQSCVTGDAAEVIGSLESSNENYEIAWKLLTDRYDNRKFIAESHVRALFNIPLVSKEFSVRALLDKLQKHVRALRALKQPVDQWDLVLIHIIKDKHSNNLREKWEESAGTSKIPTINDLTAFLERRSQIEITRFSQAQNNPNKGQRFNDRSASGHGSHPPRAFAATIPAQSQDTKNSQFQRSCPVCKEEHSIYACNKFLTLSPQERLMEAKHLSLCVNCLRGNHRPAECRLKGCRQCHKRHNSLLHFEQQFKEVSAQSSSEPRAPLRQYHLKVSSEVYLATAIVYVLDRKGNYQPCRIMLDGGAQSCAITNKCVSRLGLKKTPFDIPLLSLDHMQTKIKFVTGATFKSRFDKKKRKLELLVVDEIADAMPSMQLDSNDFEIPSNIFLADPNFHEPAPVDIIIGAEFAYSFLRTGQLRIKGHSAVLQKTILGWILAGRVYNQNSKTHNSTKMYCLLNQVEKLPILWELDPVKTTSTYSKEEQACEEHFSKHVRRDKSGRYVVKLPFNDKLKQLGDTRNVAFQRFYAIERKLEKNPSLKIQYSDCINSYLKEGHMSLSTRESLDKGYYLPHHAVVKATSLTTKTRVVFDASTKSSSGISLNQCLMVGPTIQDDLFSIFSRFRSHLFALTADIQQMYRQIKVYPEDKAYQKIIWRETPNEPIKTYDLNRVTFGTASAPYLATRTLHQLADDERDSHPLASAALKRDFYVDDLLTGTQSLQDALKLRNELIQLLHKGGFNLRKWGSNDPRLTKDFSSDSRNEHMTIDPTTTIKTLGLHWDPQSDTIVYTVKLPKSNEKITKRCILSQTAQLFDPLGLLGPVVMSAKILIQALWKYKIDWDDPVPANIRNSWLEFRNQLPFLNDVHYDRCITIPDTTETQIHGFSDASEKGYGACIYLRSTNTQSKHHCALICAKSRVAPIKVITLPNLELCAAVLLTKLYTSIIQSLQMSVDKTFFWSDSTITLNRIKIEPHELKTTFVRNRVVEINTISQPHEWLHVPTQDNPADLISRGQHPKDFLQSKIWKHGPAWLKDDHSMWPKTKLIKNEAPVDQSNKSISVFTLTISNKNKKDQSTINTDLLERYSHLRTLTHVVAYCLRFIKNLRIKNKTERVGGPLSSEEMDTAMNTIFKITQNQTFSKEMNALALGKSIDKKSSLLCLNPFLDQGVIRVGGRLQNANIPTSQKHPIVLPRNHHVTTLIIREEHIRLKHAGAQATLYGVREHYWPIDGRNVTRHIIHKCIKCFRAKPREVDYIMGNLPEKRLSYSRPFLNVGVDYCGPFFIKEKRHRNRKRAKAYVSISICFATKAVHLELVSELTTEAFLGSLKRFFSRRGKASTIHSDNGKNFIGANRELKNLYDYIQTTYNDSEVKNFLLNQKVSWHFIPPHSPHFGGLWEASVKSFKQHFIRTVGNALLTYEQLQTYVIEIEAILNSRPLTPMSSDPNDFLPLSPGHFLIGASLTSFPQADYRCLRINQMSSWQHAQQMRNHFWSRWYKEYLNEMITRSKWKKPVHQDSIAIGTLVVEKDDNLPPMCWKLARITDVHPGKDGIIRAVTLKNATGTYDRCIKKLYPLPIYTQTI